MVTRLYSEINTNCKKLGTLFMFTFNFALPSQCSMWLTQNNFSIKSFFSPKNRRCEVVNNYEVWNIYKNNRGPKVCCGKSKKETQNYGFICKTCPFLLKLPWNRELSAGTGVNLLEMGLNYRVICKTCPFLLQIC